jgi:hypothetical protein
VPTDKDLARRDRRVLDAYLANALGIELHGRRREVSTSGDPLDFETGTLKILDERQFVLTLDFLMKMLCINERIECRVPCIMEGETGVSKTALTRMLFTLKNTVPRSQSDLQRIVDEGADESPSKEDSKRQLSALRKLAIDLWAASELQTDDEGVWGDVSKLCEALCRMNVDAVAECLLDELRSDPSLDPMGGSSADAKQQDRKKARAEADKTHTTGGSGVTLQELTDVVKGRNANARQGSTAKLLEWYVSDRVTLKERREDWTFFPVDVHAALTPTDIYDDSTIGVRAVAERAVRGAFSALLRYFLALCVVCSHHGASSCRLGQCRTMSCVSRWGSLFDAAVALAQALMECGAG